jgi:CBS domain-containing protein
LHCLFDFLKGSEKVDDEIYLKVGRFREAQIKQVSRDHYRLNELHDEIMNQVLDISMKQVFPRIGPPPSPFSFFVMGSAGRLEQSVWSDQDHGIIYCDQSDEIKAYFLTLGKEISKGLYLAGYPYCAGGVMSSNPFWCKSKSEWEGQIKTWALAASWESIRYLLIFIDGRSVYGRHKLLEGLKNIVFQAVKNEHLMSRISNNTLNLKKGIGVLGQLLVETHGKHTGSLNIKEIALFPYVNTVRLLAIKNNLLKTSTLSRFEKLQVPDKESYKEMFLKLLNYRLLFSNQKDYESGHYLPVDILTKEQKNEVKDIIKHGALLHQSVRKSIEMEG